MNQLTIRSWFHPFCILSRFLSSFERINCIRMRAKFLRRKIKIWSQYMHTRTLHKNPLESNIHWCHISSIRFFLFILFHVIGGIRAICHRPSPVLFIRSAFLAGMYSISKENLWFGVSSFLQTHFAAKKYAWCTDRRFSCRMYKHKYGVSTSKLKLSPPATTTYTQRENISNVWESFSCMLYLCLVVGILDDNFWVDALRSSQPWLPLRLRRVQSFFALCSIFQMFLLLLLLIFFSFFSSYHLIVKAASILQHFVCMRLHDYNVYPKLLSNTQRCLKSAFTMHAQCYHKLFPLLSCEQEHKWTN